MTYENPESLNCQAIELASLGEYNEAIACFHKALLLDSTNYRLWYNLGLTYHALGDYPAAKKTFLKSYKLHPEDADLLESLGLTCYNMEEYDEAEDYYCEAISLNFYRDTLWNNLGVLYFARQNFEKACDAFEHALTMNPDYYNALFNLRDTYAELGNYSGVKVCEEKMRNLRQDTR